MPKETYPKITRRGAIRAFRSLLAVSAVSGSIAAADIAYAYKIGSPEYSVTPEVSAQLEQLAEQIKPYITTVEELPIDLPEGKTSLQYNVDAFAPYLLHMAFLDGGNDTVKAVMKGVASNPIDLGFTDDTSIGGNFITTEKRTRLNLSQNFAVWLFTHKNKYDADSLLTDAHEIYHAIQYYRDPNQRNIVNKITGTVEGVIVASVATIAGLGAKKLNETILPNTPREVTDKQFGQRRRLRRLSFIGGAYLSTGYGTFKKLMAENKWYSPQEYQAYAQTGQLARNGKQKLDLYSIMKYHRSLLKQVS